MKSRVIRLKHRPLSPSIYKQSLHTTNLHGHPLLEGEVTSHATELFRFRFQSRQFHPDVLLLPVNLIAIFVKFTRGVQGVVEEQIIDCLLRSIATTPSLIIVIFLLKRATTNATIYK